MSRTALAIASHQGLGDFLICNGLFRSLANQYDNVVVPVRFDYYGSIQYMLRDCPRVAVVPARDNREVITIVDAFADSQHALYLGRFGRNFLPEQFDRSFYRQANLSFETRWTSFALTRDPRVELPAPTGPYAFVHDDPVRGFYINRQRPCFSGLPTVSPRPLWGNFFVWTTVIELATEIHCIDSSFALFIDSLSLSRNSRLFLHRYARPSPTVPLYRGTWSYET